MAGRPTKYNDEILSKAENYLNNYEDAGDVMPSIVGLAYALDLHRDTVNEWGKDENKKPFSVILERISQKQHQVLINKGLSGDFNSNIVKLALGKHGYSDKQELTGKDGEKLIPASIKTVYD